MPEIKTPRLYLIDVSNYLFRSFYALPVMTNSQRQPVQAVFGLARSLIQLQLDFAPSHLLVVFDGTASKARRRLIYPEYKSNRLQTPQELVDQFPIALEMCQQMGLSVVNRSEYEADDLIAAAVHQAQAQQMACTICSSDKDLLQLVGENVDQLYTFKNNERVGIEQVRANFGISPSQISDWLALCGDASDNIPGVAGIGPKTAAQLLNQYGTLEGIIANLHELSAKRRENFDVEIARISYQLAHLQDLDDWTLDLEEVKRRVPPLEQWLPWFEKMGFRSLIKLIQKLPISSEEWSSSSSKAVTPAPSLKITPSKGTSAPSLFDLDLRSAVQHVAPQYVAPQHVAMQYIAPQYVAPQHIAMGAAVEQLEAGKAACSPSQIEEEMSLAPLELTQESSPASSQSSWPEGPARFRQLDLFASRETLSPAKSSCQVSGTELLNHLESLPLGSDLWIECLSDLKKGQKWDLWLFYTPNAFYWMRVDRVSQKIEPILSRDSLSGDSNSRGLNCRALTLALQRLKLHAYNIQFIERIWLEWGVEGILPWVEDLRLRAYLLFADGRHFDANLLFSHYEIEALASTSQMDEKLATLLEESESPLSDCAISSLLNERMSAWNRLFKRLLIEFDPEIEDLYRHVELPLASVLARMEHAGVGVDCNKLKELSIELHQQLQAIELEIFRLAGCEPINLNSPKQLAHLLYEKLGLRVIRKTKTGASTDAQVLEELYDEHPVIAEILRYRELEKLRSTYVDALPTFVKKSTGSIHPHFEQAVTSTGRLSCHEPNLQNIPVRSPEGMRIRRAFTVRKPHNVLLSADYSQIELRMMAHLSGDENLIQAFMRGEDIHRYTAALVFEISLDQISDEQRALAKAVNFGILYGQQAFGLSRQLHIPVSKASRFIEAYFERYKAVAEYVKECREKAKQLGYVTTLLGRKRYIPQIRSPKAAWRQLGERLCVNTCVQGSSADLIKLAMLRIDELLESVESQMILQIHDELIFECPETQIGALQTLVQDRMCQAAALKVPLVVNIAVGKNWMEC